jgi:hypothetical protein
MFKLSNNKRVSGHWLNRGYWQRICIGYETILSRY